MDRNIFTATARLSPVAQPVDTTASELLKTVSNTLNAEADKQFEIWKNASLKEAARLGTLEGTQDAPKYREEYTLTAEAFNEAAKKSYITNLELKASAEMAKLQNDFSNNPEEYLKKSDAYIASLSSQLKQNVETESLGTLFESRLRLSQVKAGHEISKTYMANQADTIKANNLKLYHTIATNTYKEAGGIFSKDPTEQMMTLAQFTLNQKILDQALYAVTPDGLPVYTQEAIIKKQQEFRSLFYIRAVQDYVSENEITKEDLRKIKDGTFTASVPNLGQINILDEVGADKYEKQVRNYTFTKEKEKEAARKKAETQDNAIAKEEQYTNGVALIGDILSGKPVTADKILNDLSDGKLNHVDALAATKLILDPNSGIRDDPFIIGELTMKMIDGEDISQSIKENAVNMKSTTYTRLMEDNAKIRQGAYDENKKWLVREAVKKDQFGIEDPQSIRLAKDIIDRYDQMISDGISPQLAFEKSRDAIDVIKDRANRRLYSNIPKYMELGVDNSIDIPATYKATKNAYSNGLLSDEEFEIEIERLRAMKSRREPINNE